MVKRRTHNRYHKKCEKSGMRRVLVFSVEKMFYRHSRWQNSSQHWQLRFEELQKHRKKNVKVKTKISRVVQPRQRPCIKTKQKQKHSHLKQIVAEEFALHPVVAFSRNIYSLVHAKKLSTLSVAMLRDICKGIGLSVDDVRGKRKSHLHDCTSRIMQVVKECSCARV